MSHDSHPAEDRRIGTIDRRMRERAPASDRRIESRGHRNSGDARSDDAASATVASQLLFERS